VLIGNGLRLAMNPGRLTGADQAYAIDRMASWNRGDRNWWAGEGSVQAGASIANKDAFPSGYRHPYTWQMAPKNGGMASRNRATLTLTPGALNVAAGINVAGDATLTITAGAAQLQLVVSATGTATLTLTGTGNLAGVLAAAGTAALTLTATPALLGALAGLSAAATVTLSGASTIRAIGALAGDILPYDPLSPQGLADAVKNMAVDGEYTLAEVLRLIVAAVAGKVSGGPGSPVFRDLNDTVNRITGTVDSNGNRSVVTYNAD
jgi:hypothetical protein